MGLCLSSQIAVTSAIFYLFDISWAHTRGEVHCHNQRAYSFERDRQTDRSSTSRGGAESEGDTESEAGSRLQAVSTGPDAGLEPTNRETMT